jgi:hypothetical protein
MLGACGRVLSVRGRHVSALELRSGLGRGRACRPVHLPAPPLSSERHPLCSVAVLPHHAEPAEHGVAPENDRSSTKNDHDGHARVFRGDTDAAAGGRTLGRRTATCRSEGGSKRCRTPRATAQPSASCPPTPRSMTPGHSIVLNQPSGPSPPAGSSSAGVGGRPWQRGRRGLPRSALSVLLSIAR